MTRLELALLLGLWSKPVNSDRLTQNWYDKNIFMKFWKKMVIAHKFLRCISQDILHANSDTFGTEKVFFNSKVWAKKTDQLWRKRYAGVQARVGGRVRECGCVCGFGCVWAWLLGTFAVIQNQNTFSTHNLCDTQPTRARSGADGRTLLILR